MIRLLRTSRTFSVAVFVFFTALFMGGYTAEAADDSINFLNNVEAVRQNIFNNISKIPVKTPALKKPLPSARLAPKPSIKKNNKSVNPLLQLNYFIDTATNVQQQFVKSTVNQVNDSIQILATALSSSGTAPQQQVAQNDNSVSVAAIIEEPENVAQAIPAAAYLTQQNQQADIIQSVQRSIQKAFPAKVRPTSMPSVVVTDTVSLTRVVRQILAQEVSTGSSNNTAMLATINGLLNDVANLKNSVLRTTTGSAPIPFMIPNINLGTPSGALSGDSVTLTSGGTVTTSAGNLNIDSAGGTVNVLDNLSVSGTLGVGGIAYTWPAADGDNGQVLTTNSTGTLSWTSAGGATSSISTNFEITTNSRLGINAGNSTNTSLEVGGTASISGATTLGSTLAVVSAITQTGAGASNSFTGSLNTTLGVHATTDVSANGRFLSIGVGSNSFAGSLNLAKSLTSSTNVTAALFTGSGGGSSSFAGSLNLAKSLTVTTGITTSGANTSSSFAGSLNLGKSLTSVRNVTAAQFNGTGAGSNSFAGSLNLSKSLTATNSLTAASLNITTGLATFSGSGVSVSNNFELTGAKRLAINAGAVTNATLEINSTETTNNVASISATSLTSGDVFSIRVPASTSANAAGSVLTVKDTNGLAIASLSFGGQLQLRGQIYARGAAISCTGIGAPSGACIDYAEDMPTADATISAGDVISVNASAAEAFGVEKTTRAYDNKMVGIVSTNPAIVLGESVRIGELALQLKDGVVPVALAGRVPVKISFENGDINRGDYLTSATIPGYAMKATQAGRVLGIALENVSAASGEVMVMVFVNLHYWSGEGTGQLPVEDQTLLEKVLAVLKDAVLFVHKLVAKSVVTDDLETNNAKIHNGITTYDTQTGDAYCIRVTNGQLSTMAGECTTPVVPTATPTPSPAEQPEPTPTPEVPAESPSPEPSPTDTPTPTPDMPTE